MCLKILFAYALIVSLTSASSSRDAFDCLMRQLLLEYAVEIQPDITSDQLQDIADALNGTPEKAPNCTVTPDSSMQSRRSRHAPAWEDLIEFEQELYSLQHPYNDDLNQLTLFVSTDDGDDTNAGTLVSPLQSLETAIEKAKGYDKDVYKRIILRGGKYYLSDTIRFDSSDTNYLISNFNNEQVNITGSTLLKCDWKLSKTGLLCVYCCKYARSIQHSVNTRSTKNSHYIDCIYIYSGYFMFEII